MLPTRLILTFLFILIQVKWCNSAPVISTEMENKISIPSWLSSVSYKNECEPSCVEWIKNKFASIKWITVEHILICLLVCLMIVIAASTVFLTITLRNISRQCREIMKAEAEEPVAEEVSPTSVRNYEAEAPYATIRYRPIHI